ncbi:MAG TPA: hypothetical protein VH637_25495 [Streptosporangiaceae bacterium]|jgi:hypothetical protein
MKLIRTLARAFGRIAAVVEECRYAQRRMSVLRDQPDRFLYQPDSAPDTYGDFRYRTSGPAPHEPSARARAAGRTVRT